MRGERKVKESCKLHVARFRTGGESQLIPSNVVFTSSFQGQSRNYLAACKGTPCDSCEGTFGYLSHSCGSW